MFSPFINANLTLHPTKEPHVNMTPITEKAVAAMMPQMEMTGLIPGAPAGPPRECFKEG